MTERFTPVHGLGEWDDLDTPGAAALNMNWDIIEANLVKCSGAFPASFPLNKILVRTDLFAFYLNTGTVNVPVWTSLPVIPPGFTDANRAELALGKKFFTDNGLMPANIIKEALNIFPAPDVSNPAGGTFTRKHARARFTGVGTAPANFVWNLGANYTKVLIILGGTRYEAFNLGPTVMKSLPVDGAGPDGYFLTNGTPFTLFRNNGGASYTSRGNLDALANNPGTGGPTVGMALLIDCVAQIQQCFLRYGPETWISGPDFAADASSITFARYAGIWLQTQGAADEWITCPIGIYAE